MLSPIQSRIENTDDEEFLSSIESIECGSERLIYQESLIRIEDLPIKNYWRQIYKKEHINKYEMMDLIHEPSMSFADH